MKYLPLQGARRLKRHFTWHKTSLPVPEKAAKESLLDIRFCQNCETPLTGDFCTDCGQMDRELQRPVWSLMWDSADALFDVDSRIFRTIMPLVFLPGHLTRSYNEGKRARYLPPVRLYIISSLIFFLAVSIADVAILKFEFYPADTEEVDRALAELDGGLGGLDELQTLPDETPVVELSDPGTVPESENEDPEFILSDEEGEPNAAQEQDEDGGPDITIGELGFDLEVKMFASAELSEGTVPLPPDAFDETIEELRSERQALLNDPENEEASLGIAGLKFAEEVLLGLQVASQDPRALNKELNIWIPRAMIFMLPIFALLLRMFHWAREQYLMNMLVFSLHFHSYIFLVITFFIVAQSLIGSAASAWMFALAVPVYLLIALKVATGQGVIRTFFKFVFLYFIYSTMLIVVLMGILLFGLSEI